MFAQKLKKGDEVRIIAPSVSLSQLSEENKQRAVQVFEDRGYKVTFSKNSLATSDFVNTADARLRAEDIMEAFRDPNVKLILAAFGGFLANQTLRHLDFDVIKQNPKLFCGYSDITVLSGAFWAKGGFVTYSGPNFNTFAMKEGADFTKEYFFKCMESDDPIEIGISEFYTNDDWAKNQDYRTYIKNPGTRVFHPGSCEGTILGGNLCTLNLLQGTDYMPNLDDTFLFIEDDKLAGLKFPGEFARNFQSLLHCFKPGQIKGLVLGRPEEGTNMNAGVAKDIIEQLEELRDVPVVYGFDFGHTSPAFTFPIGGRAKMTAKENGEIALVITQH